MADSEEVVNSVKPTTLPVVGIRLEVAEKLSNTSSIVRSLIVSELLEKELSKRKEAVLESISKIDEKTKELRKAESVGVYALNINGDKVGEPTFSKEQVETIKKLNNELLNLNNALTNFFDNNDPKKLFELTNKK